MSKDKKRLTSEDEKKLQDLIKQNKELFEQLSARYLLRDDLVEVTDKRYGASKIIQTEVDKLRIVIEQTTSEKNKILQGVNQLSQLNSAIEKFKSLIESRDEENDTLLLEDLEEILNQENINELKSLQNEIIEFHDKIYKNNEDEEGNTYTKINIFLSNMDKAQKFLTDTIAFDGINIAKKDFIRKQYEKIDEYYDRLFNDYEDEDSISTEINQKISDLSKFHQKIFGNETTKSLKEILDQRLQQLEYVEGEAKKVINLASDAGLAGGFVEKARQAKHNKWLFIGILSVALIIMFFYNQDILKDIPISENGINSNTIVWIMLKLSINAPLLWLAIVSNINLNKYSRLEQDYAHKEALAKSYERYKTEISKLSSNEEEIDELKQELIKINLEAFKLNPADHMEKAKSDSILDKLLAIKHLDKIDKEEIDKKE